MMWWLCSWLHLYVVVLGLLQAISAHLYDSSSRQKNDLLHSPLYEVHIHEDGISDMLMSNVFTMNGEMGYRSSRQLRAKKDDVGVIAALDKAAHSQVDYDYTLQLHKCRDSGEAYSAAYLISKEHLIHQFTDYNLTWVNCEMGSFIMMNKRSNPERNANGTLLQSLDVLDFSVIHLSAYERLQLRWARSSQVIKNDRNNLSAVITAASILRENTLKMRSLSSHLVNPAYEKTVVVMPFLGSDMGAGHSKLSNRQSYIAACFWSFHEHYSHIVAMVKSPKDRDFIRNVSGLPFYDVILLENLPKSASLPVATVQTTKRLINEGTWNFDYMFFTESDQILMMRIPEVLYSYIDKYPRQLAIPHRLMAYPVSVVEAFHKRPSIINEPFEWIHKQCCLKRQQCTDRKEWVHVSNLTLPILQIYGIQVPLGNADFHRESYRGCTLRTSNEEGFCP